MDQLCTENPTGIDLCHAAADDGDWATTVPETVHMLQTYLKTDHFAVLSLDAMPGQMVEWIFKAFENAESHTVDGGCMLELGHYHGIRAALYNDDLTAVYFARTDEQKVRDVLTGNIQVFGDFVSLAESPPRDVLSALAMFELRIWVPQLEWKIAAKHIQELFTHYLPIYVGSQDAVLVPDDVEKEIFSRLEAYFERMAICMFDGNLTREEAKTVAARHLSPVKPERPSA
jgi:hypothetical protein